ncbi:hypothetical protein G3T37_10830 [Galbitalea soli]|uniref:EfeO-type cupredoxin-like domain-containing protein n=1 Tax=Galbitalea soli TaxID=1268042 RepID=A0A7C9PNT1_9MICO|nr:hypothetical protein [Galbitalea soli]
MVIQNFEFTGLPSVKPGETVTVTNLDGVSHTVSSDDGTSFRVVVAGGSAGTFTAPTKPGSYAYHCAFHRTMHAALLVKP